MLAVFVGISGAILFYQTLPCETSNYYTVNQDRISCGSFLTIIDKLVMFTEHAVNGKRPNN
jgi:hypothetical protein